MTNTSVPPVCFVPYAVPENAENDSTMKAFRTARFREELYDVVIDQYHPFEMFQEMQADAEKVYRDASSPMMIILRGKGLLDRYKAEMAYATPHLGMDVPNYIGRPKTCPISRRVELADKIIQINADMLNKLENCGLASDMEAELKRDIVFFSKQLEYHYADVGNLEAARKYRDIAHRYITDEEECYNIANNVRGQTEYDRFVPIHDRIVRINPEAFHQMNGQQVLATNPKTGEILLDDPQMLSANTSEKTNSANNLIDALSTRSEKTVSDADMFQGSEFTR